MTDIHTDDIEPGREILANTIITLVIILILAGIGFWVGGLTA